MTKRISVEEFDCKSDEGEEDILPYLDLDSATVVSPAESKKRGKKTAKAAELDKMFDEGADLSDYIDEESVQNLNAVRRVNVDFPEWMISGLDIEAETLGISRQAVIKVWIGERLRQMNLA